MTARRVLDATDRIVAPGVVDLHTHYDAQLNWDPYATNSAWNGVTTVMIGMCGFGFAPFRPEDRDRAMLLMSRVEAIPLAAMRLGMRWDWVSFAEYLASLERAGLGINVGSLVPHSPLRTWVMGLEAAKERAATLGRGRADGAGVAHRHARRRVRLLDRSQHRGHRL